MRPSWRTGLQHRLLVPITPSMTAIRRIRAWARELRAVSAEIDRARRAHPAGSPVGRLRA